MNINRRSCTKQIKFCCAHRLVGHEGRCSSIHGHNYIAEVTVYGPKLDSVGRLVDFSVIKDEIGSWIDDNWDHAFVYNKEDENIAKQFPKEFRMYCMPHNPTAENMAEHLLRKLGQNLEYVGVTVGKVTIWETDTSYATCQLSESQISTFLKIAYHYLLALEVFKPEVKAAMQRDKHDCPIKLNAVTSVMTAGELSLIDGGMDETTAIGLRTMLFLNTCRITGDRYTVKRVLTKDHRVEWLLAYEGPIEE